MCSPVPLTWTEMGWYCRMTRTELLPQETRAIWMVDSARLKVRYEMERAEMERLKRGGK